MDNRSDISHFDALNQEFLLTGFSGTFSHSTLSGCHLKKNHGLFIACIPHFNHTPYVLLSRLNETVFLKGKGFDLGIQTNNSITPPSKKIQFISHYSANPIPEVEYSIGDVILRKEWLIREEEGSLLIQYTLLKAPSELNLLINPLLSYRKVDELTSANSNLNTLYGEKENGVSFKMYPNFPSINIQCSKTNDFSYKPTWEHGITYTHDKTNNQRYSEDLYNPGKISFLIKEGESIVLHVGTNATDPKMLKTYFEAEKRKRKLRTKASDHLRHVARQFFMVQEKHVQVLSGLPFRTVTASGFFKAIPGLRIALKNNHAFINAELGLIDELKKIIHNKKASPIFLEWNNPETFIWACWSFLLVKKTDEIGQNFYMDLVIQIIQSIRKGKINGILLHKNGLIWNESSKNIVGAQTDSSKFPNKKRKGYLVEMNAIWYNALLQAEQYLQEGLLKQKFQRLSAKCKQAFLTMFWDMENNFLVHASDGKNRKSDIRALALFAISQRYSPLGKFQQKTILDTITNDLYTANGPRGLSPKHPFYTPIYQLKPKSTLPHDGCALPSLLGSYTDALIKILGKDSFSHLEKISSHLKKEVINRNGNIPIAYNGNPPFNALEKSSCLLSIAEIARTLHTIKKYKKHMNKGKENFESILYGKIYV